MFAGGEEPWQNWSWKGSTSVSGKHSSDLTDVMKAADAKYDKGDMQVSEDTAELVQVDQAKRMKDSRVLYSMLACTLGQKPRRSIGARRYWTELKRGADYSPGSVCSESVRTRRESCSYAMRGT